MTIVLGGYRDQYLYFTKRALELGLSTFFVNARGFYRGGRMRELARILAELRALACSEFGVRARFAIYGAPLEQAMIV